MILQASVGKSLRASDLEQAGQGRCTRVTIDAALAEILSAWPRLDSRGREALLAVANAASGND